MTRLGKRSPRAKTPRVPATAIRVPVVTTLTESLNIAPASRASTNCRAQSLARRILLGVIADPTPPSSRVAKSRNPHR
jgi:aspartate-semialdehyde dehydrogenase